MIITIPQYLYKHKPETTLKIDNISFVEYKTRSNELKGEVFVNQNVVNFLISGKKIIHCAGEDVEFKAGEFALFRRGNYIFSSIIPGENSSYQSLLCFLDSNFIKDFVNRNLEMFTSVKKMNFDFDYKIFPQDDFIKNSVKSIFPYFYSKNNQLNSILKLKFDEILYNIMDSKNGDLFKSFLFNIYNEDKKNNLKDYMNDNYTNPCSVEEFAKNSFRSLTSFKKEFSEIFGTSPKKWINEKRLERAAFLLKNSSYNLTEISFMVGFENYSYFIQLFKLKYNQTPKQFQKDQI